VKKTRTTFNIEVTSMPRQYFLYISLKYKLHVVFCGIIL